MKEISEATALVFDHGLFTCIAHTLAKKFKRVLYHTPWEKSFPVLFDCIIGDGYDNIERCDDIWKAKKDVDLFVFPDIMHSGLQLELESQGFPVWGSRTGDSLEMNRQKFNRVLAEVGLEVPPFKVIKGLTNLRLHLKDETDKYIKVSKYRGNFETIHWRDYATDSLWLDQKAVEMGPAQELIQFLVVDPIECKVEVGGDTYCVDGEWPSLMIHGDEEKDRCYFGAVTPFKDMPPELRDIMQAFSPVFKKFRYRNQWSMETRDGRFIDATCRGGLPSTPSQCVNWENFPEIIYAGAHGQCLDPEPAKAFTVECALSIKDEPEDWTLTKLVKELEDRALYGNACVIDGMVCFPPHRRPSSDVGWLVANGDTMEECIDEIRRLEKLLPDGVEAATSHMIGLLKKIQEAQDEGIEFADKVPEPEAAIEG